MCRGKIAASLRTLDFRIFKIFTVAGVQSRTMNRVPCRPSISRLEPDKVMTLFCFLNSSYQRFAEAFVYLSGVLSPFHPSIYLCTWELSFTECHQAGQSSPISYAQHSTGPTCTQWHHKKPERQHSLFDVHFQQLHNTLLPIYSQIATQTAKLQKFSPAEI